MALSSTIEDHAEALTVGDTGIVSKLLDEVLIEAGLHVPAGKHQRFASALLKAHLSALQTLESREIGEEQPVAPGTMANDLPSAYLRERKLGSKSEAEFRSV